MLGASRLSYLALPQSAGVFVQRTANTVTAYGDALIDTAQSKFGGASLTTSGSGHIGIPNSPNIIMWNSDWTIEFWWYTPGNSGFDMFAGQWGSSTSSRTIFIGLNNGRQPTIYMTTNTGSTISFVGSNNTFAANTWHHMAVVATSDNIKLYVNGTLDGSYGSRPTLNTSGTYDFTALRSAINGDASVAGTYLDEIRVSNTARYTSNFTPSTTPFINDSNTLLLLHMNGTDGSRYFDDDNGVRSQAGVWAQGGANLSNAAYKFGSSSAYFNGTSTDYINYNTHQSITGDFTIEGWIRFLGVPSTGDNGFMIFWLSNSSNYINLYGTNSLQLAVGGKYGTVSLPTTPAINTWYHLAVVRNSGEYKVYWNGVDAGAFTNDSGWPASGTYDWLGTGQFGKFTDARGDWYGYMDEIRLSNTARYTGNFTPPTEAFTDDNNTLMLLHMEGVNGSTRFIDDNGLTPQPNNYSRPIEVYSIFDAQVSTASSKFGGASYLGQTGKRLEASMNLPQEDFTIEWWANQTNRSATSGQWEIVAGSHIVRLRSGEIGGQIRNIGLLIYDESGNIILNWASPGGTLPDNTWTFIAVTYVASNTTFRVYMNNTRRLEQSVPTFTMPDTTTFKIGAGPDGSYMRGYLDEFRISNIARYTGSSLTVPTAAFTNDANTLLLLHMDGANGSTTFTDDNG